MRTCTLFLVITAVFGILVSAQSPNSFASELLRLRVHTALLFPSSAVDESPVWSPDSLHLAANIQGNWFSLDTRSLQLHPAKWHDRQIAVVTKDQKFSPMTQEQVDAWLKQASSKRRGVTSKSGVNVEATTNDLLSTGIVLSNGKSQKTIWKSELETCGALSVSPDGQYVAFICETNGVLVMDIDRAFAAK